MQRIAVIDANRVVGQASGRIISSMTANGDSLLNGSTTNITAGGTTIGSITLVSQSGGGNDDDDDGAQ